MLEKEPSKCKDLHDTHKQGLNDKTSGAHWCDPSTGKKRGEQLEVSQTGLGGWEGGKNLFQGFGNPGGWTHIFFYIECDLTQATSSSLLLL